MKKVTIIRYGEIFLKGNNRDYFVSLLIRNIKNALHGISYTFVKTQGRYLVEDYSNEDEGEIAERLLRVFGIYSISQGVVVDTDMDEIKQVCLSMAKPDKTFRVTVNRADKRVPMTSTQIGAEIGGYILDNKPELVVNLFDFDTEINVDIRENGKTLIFVGKKLAVGGLPVGCSGNGMLMLSGGIDSPVAGYLMAKRGLRLFAVHFHSAPYTSEQAKQKVVDLAKIMTKYTGNIRLLVVPFTEIQMEIHKNCPAEFMITIMRRFMMRIAEKLAYDNECGAVITGESLGQVASQTLPSINSTNSVAKIPVLRPLIGFDKNEIIAISEKIGTFETSILPFEDCCTIFLPKNPATKPRLSVVERAESVLPVEELVERAIGGVETIDVTSYNKN